MGIRSDEGARVGRGFSVGAALVAALLLACVLPEGYAGASGDPPGFISVQQLDYGPDSVRDLTLVGNPAGAFTILWTSQDVNGLVNLSAGFRSSFPGFVQTAAHPNALFNNVTSFDATPTRGLAFGTSNGSAGHEVYATYDRFGLFWTSYRVEGTTAPSSSGPSQTRIFADANNITVVWAAYNQSSFSVDLYANRSASGVWGGAQLLENLPGTVSNLQGAVDAAGSVTLAWVQNNGGSSSVYTRRLVAGAWGPLTPMVLPGALYASWVGVAADPGGNVTLVWSDSNTTAAHVVANRLPAGGAWGNPVVLANISSLPEAPRVAVDGVGGARAVWVDYPFPSLSLYSARYVAGSGWGAPETLDGNRSYISSADLGVAGDGSASVLWNAMGSGNAHLMFERYTPGLGWRAPGELTPAFGPLTSVGRSRIAVQSNGNASVATVESIGNVGHTILRDFIPDDTAPVLTVTSPAAGANLNESSVQVLGTTEAGASLVVNGVRADVASDGSFTVRVALAEGANTIAATATDASGNVGRAWVNVTYTSPVPGLEQALTNSESNVTAARAAIASLQANLTATEGNLAGAQAQLAAVQADLQVASASLAGAQANLTVQQARVDALEADANASQADLAAARADLTAAQANVTAEGARVSALESANATAAAEIATANRRISTLETQLVTAQANLGALSAAVDANAASANSSKSAADAARSDAASANSAAAAASSFAMLGLLVGVAAIALAGVSMMRARHGGTNDGWKASAPPTEGEAEAMKVKEKGNQPK